MKEQSSHPPPGSPSSGVRIQKIIYEVQDGQPLFQVSVNHVLISLADDFGYAPKALEALEALPPELNFRYDEQVLSEITATNP